MFPLEIIFNIAAAIAFLIYWVAAFIVLYHLTRFGIGVQPKRLAAIFLFGSLIFSALSIVLFMNVNITSLIPK
ncbi:MAG: hypothetical protein WD896_00515 [Parcubacteria group bacterium]